MASLHTIDQGWTHVEPGTLTLANVDPLPASVLASVEPLGTEPGDLFDDDNHRYANFLRQQRGQRRYYGGLARSAKNSHVAIVSFQDTPPCPHWLDVYSNEKLRDVLVVQTGDSVTILLFHAKDWLQAQT